ncbi:MAG: hypothetical protein RMN24_03900 [Anaerolineae bacterium]|nr:hypothetical protein [Anaerolineae bacterium]
MFTIPDLDGVYCLTVDVEWAHPEVLDDIRRLFDAAKVRATFFCTHAGVEVAGHERALHPNFRRTGDTIREVQRRNGAAYHALSDEDVIRQVMEITSTFCPEALGVRAHSLFYTSEAVRIYREFGLEYDSSYMIPMVEGLIPFWKEYDLLEIPIYYMDHLDIISSITGFDADALTVLSKGIKVLDFHPNLVFINAASEEQYLQSKRWYHDPEHLYRMRLLRGVRTVLCDLLEWIQGHSVLTMTLSEVNALCRLSCRK